jgi:UDP-3-O-[3-hydroxymyristoyl] N-acetylglucosamine deacetylase
MQVEASQLEAVSSAPPPRFQQTLAQEFLKVGVGLHTGSTVQVKVLSAPVGYGRRFVRVDLPNAPEIPAQVGFVHQTLLSTELKLETAPIQTQTQTQTQIQIRTVEHLLAALVGMGVDNARIEIDGPEVPLLDGSALEWGRAIAQAGVISQPSAHPVWAIQEPVWIREGDAFVAALPAPELRFTYGIDFDLSAIGNQWHSWAPSPDGSAGNSIWDSSFMEEIAPARTFGLLHQIEYLRAQGLIKGGSLDNALVCGPDGWVNPPLRFPNEPARHKLLDLMGDLSLLGEIPTAHFLAYKASHTLHTQLARSLNQQRTSTN